MHRRKRKMFEILLILWFSLICCMLAGGILGYQLGMALTVRKYEQEQKVWLADLDEILNKEETP